MKYLHFIFLFIVISINRTDLPAQNSKDIYCKDVPITFFGIDFSEAKGIRLGISASEMVEEFIPEINLILTQEKGKNSISNAFNKSIVKIDLREVTKQNALIDTNKFMIDNAESVNIINASKISEIVKHYSPEEKTGVGLLFIVQSLDKVNRLAAYHFVFFTMPDAKIIRDDVFVGEPRGRGFCNSWATSVSNAMKRVIDNHFGYYIGLKNDTVYGSFDIQDYSSMRFQSEGANYMKLQYNVDFKEIDNKNKELTLKPKKIKSYSFSYDGKLVEMIAVKNKVGVKNFLGYEPRFVFLKVELGGFLRLLSYDRVPEFAGRNRIEKEFVLQKNGGKLYKLTVAMNFRKNISELLSDYPELSEKIANKEYTKEDIYKILYDYNKWYSGEILDFNVTNITDTIKFQNFTKVILTSNNNCNSKFVRKGNILEFTIKNDVFFEKNLIIPTGSKAKCIVMVSKKAKPPGIPGYLELKLYSVQSADGKEILLEGFSNTKIIGKSRKGFVYGMSFGFCYPTLGVSLFCLFIKGKEAEIKSGNLIELVNNADKDKQLK